jgi:hypothetical protein
MIVKTHFLKQVGGRMMTMKNSILMVFAVIVILSACSQQTMSYEGISEHWHVNVTVVQNGGQIENDIVMTYVGEKHEPITKIMYEFEGPMSQIGGEPQVNEEGIVHVEHTLNSKVFSEDMIVTIKWNGQEESFPLVKK